MGILEKLSKKGWFCKTWEGELAMTTVPGTAPQIFQFSVRDDATAHRIEQAAGPEELLAATPEVEWILKDVSFAIEPDQTAAIVGHTGAGKTTIIGLMMLSAGPGTSITVSAAGPQAQAALDAITELVAAKFNEENM